eukprot:scaffold289455_cov14-Tisochrysis_lutea.AAC.1
MGVTANVFLGCNLIRSRELFIAPDPPLLKHPTGETDHLHLHQSSAVMLSMLLFSVVMSCKYSHPAHSRDGAKIYIHTRTLAHTRASLAVQAERRHVDAGVKEAPERGEGAEGSHQQLGDFRGGIPEETGRGQQRAGAQAH